MSKITFTRNAGSHKQGDTTDVSQSIADRLIEAGVAEPVKAPTKRAPKSGGDEG
ncbi:hypothetical protein [Agrococcus sp. DT81.2]|uniref:hypothetical protein n=1 Tax=Agrococcus sp. DT81.2 TaxID=3393414 RepID=UPI003CE4D169